jgi:hypothetical protein
MLYTIFTVKDRDYKLRLNAKACVDLEKSLGTNPINVFIKMGAGDSINLPSLGDLISILHASLQPLNHGFNLDKTYELYDEYISDGHNMTDLIPVVIDVFKVSGLLPEEVKEVSEEKNA